MCRNIKVLFHFEPPTTRDEMRAAALQYVRKVSGVTKVSVENQRAFDRAVDDVARATEVLLAGLVVKGPPRTRESEAAKAKAKWLRREERIKAR